MKFNRIGHVVMPTLLSLILLATPISATAPNPSVDFSPSAERPMVADPTDVPPPSETAPQSLFERLKGDESLTLTLEAGTYVLDEALKLENRDIKLIAQGAVKLIRTHYDRKAPLITLGTNSRFTLEATAAGASFEITGAPPTIDRPSNWIKVNSQARLTCLGQVNFHNLTAGWFDGAVVENRGGIVNLEGTQFNKITARNGGVLYNIGGGEMTLKQVTSHDTYASHAGGFIYNQATVTLEQVTITQSRSNTYGAALYNSGKARIKDLRLGQPLADHFGAHSIVVAKGSDLLLQGSIDLDKSKIHLNQGQHLRIDETFTSDTPLILQIDQAQPGQTIVESPSIKASEIQRLFRANPHLLTSNADDTGLQIAAADETQFLQYLDAPYQDQLGFELRSELRGEANQANVRSQIQNFFQNSPTEQHYYLTLFENILKNFAHTQTHRSEMEQAVLPLSARGSADAERQRTLQWYRQDNRDLTGLFVRPGSNAIFDQDPQHKDHAILNIFLETEASQPAVQLVWRKLGEYDGSGSWAELGIRSTSLKKGFNRIFIAANAHNNPYALYFRNNSQTPARVRILAEDAHASKTADANIATLPASAAPLNLGTQLGVYPTYIHDPKAPERLWDLIEFNRSRADQLARISYLPPANMADFSWGPIDLSTASSITEEAYREIKNPQQAASIATRAYELAVSRTAHFQNFEGYDPKQTTGPQAPTTQRIVIIGANNIWKPSWTFAINDYYHVSPSIAQGILRGDYSIVYSWANSHEYGHVLDNVYTLLPEYTNNVYSIAGQLLRYELDLKHNRDEATQVPTYKTVTAYSHPAVQEGQNKTFKWLNRVLIDPSLQAEADTEKQSFFAGGQFQDTFNIWTLFKYFDHYDYSDYPYGTTPFTAEKAQEIKQYGAFGTALRRLRADAPWRAQLAQAAPGAAGNRKWQYNRFLMMASDATGFNLVPLFEKRGFPVLEPVRQFCAAYAECPVKLEYYTLDQELRQIQHEVLGRYTPFNPQKTSAWIERGISGGPLVFADQPLGKQATFFVNTDGDLGATAVYELLYKGEPVAIVNTSEVANNGTNGTRNSVSFTVSNVPEGSLYGDYSVRAYDWRLQPSLEDRSVEISYDLQGGRFDEPMDGTQVVKSTLHKQIQLLKAPTKAGDVFKGWRLAGIAPTQADHRYEAESFHKLVDLVNDLPKPRNRRSAEVEGVSPIRLTLLATWERPGVNLEEGQPIPEETKPPVVTPDPTPEKPQPPVVDPEPTPEQPQPPVVDPEPTPEQPQPPVVIPEPTPEQPQPPVVDPDPTPEQPQPPVVDPVPTPEQPKPPVVDPEPTPEQPQPPVVIPEPTPEQPQPPVVEPDPTPEQPQPPVVIPEPTPEQPQPPVVIQPSKSRQGSHGEPAADAIPVTGMGQTTPYHIIWPLLVALTLAPLLRSNRSQIKKD